MLRNYEAARAYEAIKDSHAFSIPNAKRKKLNQHSALYAFKDGSFLQINATSSRADTWHKDWQGTAKDIHLGPQQGLHLNINRMGV